ncbi:MAG TPA: ankyrin repeat domain-containing protein [Gammaproteobacteria bacterium]|nr:ankyrin repeat domain-containing protein [Gammaproteobacteria bacterium]
MFSSSKKYPSQKVACTRSTRNVVNIKSDNSTEPRPSSFVPTVQDPIHSNNNNLDIGMEEIDMELVELNDPQHLLATYAEKGNSQKLKELLEKHSASLDLNLKNKAGFTLLQYASRNGHASVVSVLLPYLNKAQINKCGNLAKRHNDTFHCNALHLAALCGDSDVIKELLKYPDKLDVNLPSISKQYGFSEGRKNPAIYHAATHGHTACIALLLTHPSIDVHVVRPTLSRHLIRGYEDPHRVVPIFAAIKKGHTEVVNILLQDILQRGGIKNLYWHTDDGYNLFSYTIESGKIDILNLLLEAQPPIKMKWSESIATQFLKISAKKGYHEIFEKLLDICPESIFKKRKNIEYLFHIAKENQHADIIAILMQKKATYIDLSNIDTREAIQFAAANGYKELANQFLNDGPKVTIRRSP